jgi:hypothetical protein
MAGENPNICSKELMPDVLNSLESLRKMHLGRQEAHMAERADSILAALQRREQDACREELQHALEETYQARLERAWEADAELRERAELTRENIYARNAEELARVRERHEGELAEFTSRWQKPLFLKRYNRASVHLQGLRRRSAILLGQRKYDEMRSTDLEAQVAEERERNEHFRAMAMSYDEQLKHLQERHAREMEMVLAIHRQRIDEFCVTADIADENAMKRVTVLERKISGLANPEVVWNRQHRFEGKTVGRSMAPVKLGTSPVEGKEFSLLKLNPIAELKKPPLKGKVWRAHTPIRISL